MQIHFKAPSVEELDKLFDQYTIESFIAQGGMGAVYLATQKSLDRKVAIKILPNEFGEQAEQYHDSFQQEAKAMAKVNHVNLVAVYDFGKVDNMLYITMEYVEGQTLFEIAHKKKVEIKEASAIIVSVCRGLHIAHEAGLIHRDIKPANILINSKGEPKIVDFGLATLEADNEYDGGLIYGTPGYTAPEVLKNPGNIDSKADIFSVGIMFYELITGELPNEQYYQNPSCYSEANLIFDNLILQAVQPSITHRYASAEQMADDIEAIIANGGQTAFGANLNPLLQHTPSSGHFSTAVSVPNVGQAPQQLPKFKSAKSSGPILFLLLFLLAIGVGAVVYVNWGNKDTGSANTNQNTANTKPVDTPPAKPSKPVKPKPAPPKKTDRIEELNKKLAHHYDFKEGQQDLKGNLSFNLANNAKISGNKLRLNQGSNYGYIDGSAFNDAKSSFTIELWANYKETPNIESPILFSIGSTGSKTKALGLSPDQNGKLTPEIVIQEKNGAFRNSFGRSKGPLSHNKLSHIVFVVNKARSNVRVFINGRIASRFNSNISFSDLTASSIFFGKSHVNKNGPFTGSISSIKIYHAAVNSQDIKTLFKKGI